MRPTDYRPEIDGLRGLAVLAVMLFHAGVGWAQGGWVGVDIFFVISGYLITRLITGQVAQGQFALRDFWLRRIRRVLPALLLVMLLTLPFAVIWLLPGQLRDYGQSLTATALMANNILLYLTGGYWAEPVQFKPLVHSWSLGVEEQFYLILPPLMALLARRGGDRGLRVALGAMVAASYMLALAWAMRDADAAFLLLPARVWELGIGGLVALYPRRTAVAGSGWAAWAGLAMIGAALVLFHDGLGPAPLLMAAPVAGAALVLRSATPTQGAGRVLSARPLVAVGLVSYSAYLLHQPVFAFWRLVSWQAPAPALMALAILPILIVAWASWRWVETPLRDRGRIADRTVLIACGGLTLLLAGTGYALDRTNGGAANWPELAGAGDGASYVDAPRRLAPTRLDPRLRDGNLLVIGNSMARDAINMAVDGGGIAPARVAYVEQDSCSRAAISASLALAGRADTVIVATSIGREQAPCYRLWAQRLAAAGVAHPLVLAPKQFGWSINPALRLPPAERIALRVAPLAPYPAILRELQEVLPAGQVLDPLGGVRDAQGRVPLFTPDGLLVTQDRRHLTPAGARWLGGMLFQAPQLRHLRSAPRDQS
ncbi:MAG: acyltransferase [Sphingomonadales bacterium]|nr:acyltransferase [Sphingomonadales bacterium]MBD3774797.1 acyltransferase [Paracoccaceae bacterium]